MKSGGYAAEEAFQRFMTVGGFPEPFWPMTKERPGAGGGRGSIGSCVRIPRPGGGTLIQLLGLFLDTLRHRVGGVLTLSNLAGDLQISPKTAKTWLEILERMYLVFCVRPYTKSLPRAIQKPPKAYFFYTGDVLGDEGARFENLVASPCSSGCTFWKTGRATAATCVSSVTRKAGR
jgi:predicted AAA+ superfamily ATPase